MSFLIIDLILMFLFLLSFIFIGLDLLFKEDSYKNYDRTYNFYFFMLCFTSGYELGKLFLN